MGNRVLTCKRLPVQTTYLFLQAFLKYFYSQEMLTTSEIKFKWHLTFTLSVRLQTIMTFYEENNGRNELSLWAWTMYMYSMLVYKQVENDNMANH